MTMKPPDPPAAAPAGAPAAPPAPAPAVASPAPAAAAPEAPAAPAVLAARVPTRKLLADTDDDIPADADLLELSRAGLKSRLDRYSKRQLKELFGTDNPDEIRAAIAERDTLKQAAEAKRLADLSEVDRLKEQNAQSIRRAETAEQRATQLEEDYAVAGEDRRIGKILRKHMDADYIPYERKLLAAYLSNATDDELKEADALVEKWAKDRVAAKPIVGRKAAAPVAAGDTLTAAPVATPGSPAAAPAAPVAVPLSSGADPNATRPASPGGTHQGPALAGKTPEPGKPNSMTPAEYRQYKQSSGL